MPSEKFKANAKTNSEINIQWNDLLYSFSTIKSNSCFQWGIVYSNTSTSSPIWIAWTMCTHWTRIAIVRKSMSRSTYMHSIYKQTIHNSRARVFIRMSCSVSELPSGCRLRGTSQSGSTGPLNTSLGGTQNNSNVGGPLQRPQSQKHGCFCWCCCCSCSWWVWIFSAKLFSSTDCLPFGFPFFILHFFPLLLSSACRVWVCFQLLTLSFVFLFLLHSILCAHKNNRAKWWVENWKFTSFVLSVCQRDPGQIKHWIDNWFSVF